MSYHYNRQYPSQNLTSMFISLYLIAFVLFIYFKNLAKILSIQWIIVLENVLKDYFIAVGMCILLASRSQDEC